MKKYTLILLLLAASLSVGAQNVRTINDSTRLVSAKKELGTFFTTMNAAGLNNIFDGTTVTILAPDNEAFAKLPAGTVDSLLKPANKAALISLLNDHIIAGKLTSKDIGKMIRSGNGQTELTTLSGNKLTARINVNRNIVLIDENGNESILKQFDINDGNAVIFVISAVILQKK